MAVTVTRDAVSAMMGAVRDLTRQQVMVGVPDANAGRDPALAGDSGPITNAELAYIHDNGAPEAHIPARPFMRPGVNAIVHRAAGLMVAGAKKALTGDAEAGEAALAKVGLVAQASIRATITKGEGFAPLSERTLQERAARGRKGAAKELASRAAGNAPNAANARPLIDTGQLRNSITYAIRKT